ncbi:MAG: DUF4214 domain-containing protein [Betaproteobacteria bacterium]|nr:DUF4214 domain-containing protein [Betaproteobacteria bacterium]
MHPARPGDQPRLGTTKQTLTPKQPRQRPTFRLTQSSLLATALAACLVAEAATPLQADLAPTASVATVGTAPSRLAAPLDAVSAKGDREIAALSEGRLVVSKDGGASWRDRSPAGGASLTALQFVDARQGWALDRAGDGATVWRTQDGGASWLAAPLPLSAPAGTINLHFVDGDTGFAIARLPSSANFSFARLYATQDGGASWRELREPPAMGELKFISATHGWLLGGADGSALYQTRNGGASWHPLRISDVPDGALMMPGLPLQTSDGLRIPVLVSRLDADGNIVGQSLRDYRASGFGTTTLEGEAALSLHGGAARLVSDTRSAVLSGPARFAIPAVALSFPVDIESSGTLKATTSAGGTRWWLSADGECLDKITCANAERLTAFDAAGNATEVPAPARTPESAAAAASAAKRVFQSTRQGIDVCSVPSLSTLTTWFNSSPYRDVNFYMGGRNRACSQPLLNANWITQTLNQGWGLIPTWVGYQSPTTSCSSCAKHSTNTTTARSQGVAEADLAANAAEALGITKPNVIYFNFEQYNSDTAAERSFIDGWATQLRARGYVPSMYVHWSNVDNFATLEGQLESVWIARWKGVGGTASGTPANPNTITGVANNLYVNKRIWQWWGEVGQTWGGVNIPGLDLNVANGPVIAKDITAQPQTITFNALVNRVINTAAFDVSASASSGLPVTFVSQTPSICTVSGTRTTLLAVGTCTLRASQAGNTNWQAAPNVDRSFSIAAQTQSISFAALPSRVLSPVTFDLNAGTTSGLLPTYASLTTSICTVDGDRLRTLALGTCTVRASQAGNAKVLAAASVDQSFQVIDVSACGTAVSAADCDVDGIPNGVEASVSKSPTVRDNDVFTANNLFVMQAFRDVLKREATSAEVTQWSNDLASGAQTRASMIESFFGRADFGGKHAPVARLYLAFFGRTPQWTGQQYWAGQLGAKTLAQIADAFADSAEFITTYGTLDNGPYVTRVYQNTLGRAPTSSELSAGVADLNSGAKTRGSLMTGLSEAGTFVAASKNRVDAILTYWGVLQRRPDDSGYTWWVGQLDSGAKTRAAMISGFIGSPEYRARFLP